MTDPWSPTLGSGKHITTARSACVYNRWLGGKDNFAADRAVAAAVAKAHPGIVDAVRANRDYMAYAVDTMAWAGIDQFLDVGAGIPTPPNVHEISQAVDARCRVVYVDNDPVVLAYGRAFMDVPGVHMLTGDMTDPDALLDQVAEQQLLDLSRPVGLLLVAVLHFVVHDPTARQIVSALTTRLAPGSQVAITHTWDDGGDQGAAVRAAAGQYASTAVPFRARTRAQIAALYDGLNLLYPGLHQLDHDGQSVTVLAGIAEIGTRS
jgi:hypothetical protein